MTKLDFATRVVLAAMQRRELATLTAPQIEREASIGSAGVIDAAIETLMARGLVVSHRVGRGVPILFSLTEAGRGYRP